MKNYKVLAKEVIGIRGAKYKKGSVVNSSYFHSGHAKILETKGAIEELKPDKPKSTKEAKE